MAKRKVKKNKRKILYPLSALVLVCLVVGGYFFYHHYVKKNSPAVVSSSRSIYSKPVANPNVPGSSVSTSQGAGIVSNKGVSSSAAPPVSSSVQPETPIGEFVSNHRPNLSGSPAPNTENSTCTTTAGVKCTIQFSFGSTVKSLPSQTTDSNGNTSWNWTLQSVGLSEGTWQVTAIASNGSKSASTIDINKLVVSQ